MPVIVSKANKSLIVPFVSTAQSPVFPDAVVLDSAHSIVPHGMRETLLLRHMGFKVPNPALLYYDWCNGTPFAVQKATVEMLTEHPRAYVLSELGVGKTKAALWAWHFLYKEGLAGKLLVVAPLSTLKFVWANEVFATLPGMTVSILHGTRKQRLEALAEKADIFIVNHDGLRTIYKELVARKDITCLVLDEVAVYRNNSDRSKLMRKFAKGFNTVWAMSGAPLPNSPVDAWGQCRIVTPDTVPESRRIAVDMLMTRVSQFVWRPKPNAIDTAFSWMRPSVRFTLDEVVELPEVVERTIDVDMSAQQKQVYSTISKDLVAMVHDKKVSALNAGVALGKLLQVSLGWVYSNNPEFVRLDNAPRVAALLDLIESAEHKVLVFCAYRHAVEGLAGIFERLKVSFDTCVIHGDVKNRDELFTCFQKTDKYKVMLAHPQCLAHGLNLTAASTIIWFGPIASLETFEQANARITRVGQKHRQQILMMQGSPVEKRLYGLLRSKQKLQDKFLALVEDAT